MLLYLIALIALKILEIENIQRDYMRAIGGTGCMMPERAAGPLQPQKDQDRLSRCIETGRHGLGGQKCPGSSSCENKHRPQERHYQIGVLTCAHGVGGG